MGPLASSVFFVFCFFLGTYSIIPLHQPGNAEKIRDGSEGVHAHSRYVEEGKPQRVAWARSVSRARLGSARDAGPLPSTRLGELNNLD